MLGEVGLIVFGGLLGIVSHLILSEIGGRRRFKAIRKAIAVELHEMRFYVCLALVQFARDSRTMDQQALDLVKPLVTAYVEQRDNPSYMAATMDLFAQGDEMVIAAVNTGGDPNTTRYPVTYELPFLTAHLADIQDLAVSQQNALFRVIREVKLFNEKAAYVQQAHNRTFNSSLSQESAAANERNLDAGIRDLGVRARMLIEAINEVAP